MARTFLYQCNVTRDCNLRCSHCYIHSLVKKKSGEITPENILRILTGIGNHMDGNGRDHAEIHIIGGEPTMLGLEFFQEMMPQARKILDGRGWTYELIMVSNLVSSESLEIARFFDRINTSWEPISRFPKAKLEQKWRDNVHLLKSQGIDVGCTTAMTKPVLEMGAAAILDRLYYDQGIKQIHFGFFIPSGDGLTNIDAMLPEFHETSQFLKDACEWYLARREGDPDLFVNPVESMLAALHTGESVDDIVCPIIAGSMDIDWDGRTATCLEAGGNIDAKFTGNVLETSVTEVANDPGFRRDVIKASRPNRGCNGCPFYNVCRSGCGVLARHWDPDKDKDCPGFRGFISHMAELEAGGLKPKYSAYGGKTVGC